MDIESLQLHFLYPEVALLVGACSVLLIGVFTTVMSKASSYWFAQISLIATFVLLLQQPNEGVWFAANQFFVLDPLAVVTKGAILLITALALVYSRSYVERHQLAHTEYYVLLLFACLGMMVIASAANLLTIYLGLELLSLSLYALVAIKRDVAACAEAAMKYFVLGAIASGMLLYGMSILYGLTGTLYIAELSNLMSEASDVPLAWTFAIVFIVVGVAFKIGAAPFHMWLPDVYQGAPIAVTMFISSAPKIAGFVLAYRLLMDGAGSMQAYWQDILIGLIVLSLVIGNVVAIAQTNIRRMLAYSTISHMGFMLLGFMVGSAQGMSAALFYTLVYALMSIGVFAVLIAVGKTEAEIQTLEDLRGLNKTYPWMAFLLLLFMFSMAGIPLTVGFYAKLSVLQVVVEADLVWLAIAAVLASVVGAFYYLRVVKMMYFDEPADPTLGSVSFGYKSIVSINALLMVGLFIYPQWLLALCSQALS